MRTTATGVLALGLVLCVDLCGALPAPAAAQEPAKPLTVAQERTKAARQELQKAVDASKSASKVLLVTFGTDAGRAKANEAVLTTPVTAAWVSRHAMLHAVSDVGLVRELTESGLKQTPGGDPLMFVDGVLAPLDKAGSCLVLPGLPRADVKTPTGRYSISLGLRLDWTLRSPVFKEEFLTRHAQTVPARPWPGTVDGAGPALLKGLSTARDLARAKQWPEAADAYAAAWFAAGGDPWWAGVRCGDMAAEMSLIAAQSPLARQRFERLRSEYAGALELSDMRQVHEYLVLCRVLGDHEHNLKVLDEVLNARGSVTLLPPADVMALDWLLPACHFNDPLEGVSRPHAMVVQLLRQCAKMEGRKDAPTLAGAVRYGRWLARLEAGRRMGALLRQGEAGAEKASVLRLETLKEDPSPEMRRALVGAAVASGHKPAWLAEVLEGAQTPELQEAIK